MFCLLNVFFFDLQFNFFALNIQPQPVVDTHVLVCYPDQSEQRHHISAPVRIEKLESREREKEGRDVMAKAILAREDIEDFRLKKPRAALHLPWQYSRGSRRISSCVTVHATEATGIARTKSHAN